MSIGIDLAWMVAIALAAVRLGPMFILTPVFGMGDVPLRVRALLALALAATMVSAAGWRADPSALAPGGFVAAAAGEALLGAALAFGLLAAFATFLLGGRILDIQMGFGVGTLIDPTTRGHAPILGTGLQLLGIAVFLAADGHHAIVRGFAWSLERVALGHARGAFDAAAVAAHFGLVFAYGLVIVAPAVFTLLLIDIALAVAGRTMPQMNVFIIALPIKTFFGLLMLALSTRYLLPPMRRIFESVPLYWERLLA